MTPGNAGIARGAHNANPIASTDTLTSRNFYSAEVGEVVAHVVVSNKGDRLAAAGARSIKFFHPFVDCASLGNRASSWCEHMGVTTLYVDSRVVNVIAWIVDCNFGEWKNIEHGRLIVRDQTLCRNEEHGNCDNRDSNHRFINLVDAWLQAHTCDRSVAAPNVTVDL